MAKNLVIVESPAKARTIQKFLGEDYIVKPSFGHIRDLEDKDLSIDIENDFAPKYVVPADKANVVGDLKALAAKSSQVWLASDEDREGEAISWHLLETLGLDAEKTKRIVFHEITKTAIQNAIANPRTIDMNLVNAQQARRVLDRLVGFELSPILWRRIQRGLSAGRVQSVALRLVVDREKEIMAFNPEPFYKVEGVFVPQGLRSYIKASLDTKFQSASEAEQFLSDCIGATFSIGSIETKDGLRHPAPPFTTSTLQQEAARKLHFPVSTTMRIAQGLYEKGLITYMRTDSTNLSSLALGASKNYIEQHYGEEYSHVRQFQTKIKGAQEAHEAIRPTFMENVEIEGTVQEQKLYSLIWKRTIASQMADARLANTSIIVDSDKRSEKFTINASRVLFDGFLKVYLEGKDDEGEEDMDISLPELHVGQKLSNKSISADCKFTSAPSRYSEASLVKKLEELGIGRPSTYSAIITTLTSGRGYIARGDQPGKSREVKNYILKDGALSSVVKVETLGAEKGKLLPQEIGMIVSDYLLENFTDIMNYDFTANVENDFDKIADGDLRWTDAIKTFYSPFHKKVEDTLSSKKFVSVSRDLGTDPKSGLPVVAKYGQFGAYVQIGDGENKKYASLRKEQLIETITLEEAMDLFALPRVAGSMDGKEIVVTTGRFGPYLKFDGKNISLPKGKDPLSVSEQECISIIQSESGSDAASSNIIREFAESDISIINGRYGPYIKHGGQNYKIPKGSDASTLDEQACKDIIANAEPTSGKKRFNRKRSTK